MKAFSYPVVNIAVGEHSIEVFYTVKSFPVISVLKTLFNGPQVHGVFNDGIIILKDLKEISINTPKSIFKISVP